MCKVLIMPKVNGPKAVQFIKRMGEKMSLGNSDGLGYAAVDKEGNLFSQKWLHNYEAFKTDEDVPKVKDPLDCIAKTLSDFKSKSCYGLSGETSTHGTPDLNKAVAVTLHTRMATSSKGLMNAHPFIDPHHDTSLIHNGVISNEKDFDFKLSTCDSESILISYIKQRVNLYPEMVQAMADMLNGYYACGVFSRDRTGKRILDVFKGQSANLYAVHIPEFDSIVFTTSKFDVEDVCEEMGLNHGQCFSVNDGHLIRFDVSNNNIISITDFKPNSRYSYNNWGAREKPVVKNTYIPKKTYSPDIINMMKLHPKLEELSPYAVKLFLDNNKMERVVS